MVIDLDVDTVDSLPASTGRNRRVLRGPRLATSPARTVVRCLMDASGHKFVMRGKLDMAFNKC